MPLHPSQNAAWKRTLNIIREAEQMRKDIITEEPIKLDTQYVFQLYATFCGDVERTAAASGLQPIDIVRLADEEGWAEKLASIIKLKKSGRPGDIERAISRAMNFVQAHRMRLFLDRIVSKLTSLSEEEILKYMMTTTTKTSKDGTVSESMALNTRPFADLTASLEKVHHMLYMALADSPNERDKRRDAGGDEASQADIHTAIAEAMSKVGKGPVRATLTEAQLAMAEEQRNAAIAAGEIPVMSKPKGDYLPNPPEASKG